MKREKACPWLERYEPLVELVRSLSVCSGSNRTMNEFNGTNKDP